MMQRIFIDATYTLASGKNSGIERVVRSLLRESSLLGQAGDIPMPQLVFSHNEKFYEVDARLLAEFSRTSAMHANVLGSMPPGYRGLASGLCRLSGSRKLRKWLLPQAGHLGIFKLPHSLREAAIRRRLGRQHTPLQFAPGDLLLLPDAYWVNRLRSNVWPAAAEARAQGSWIASVLYDLIPLTHPDFVGVKRRDAFLDYLKKAATHSDLLLAISHTVRDQVASYLPTLAGPHDRFCQDIRAFPLGAELQTATGPVREEVRRLFDAPQAPYLMVATFDPRKNHRDVLDAFDLLWDQGSELKLCLVGRIGSRCDDILQRVRTHARLGKQLYLFDDLSDCELHHGYAGARGVIFPSVVEGFGLPIVESLWYGRKTFVSDTPIHREVGQGDCCYFQIDVPGSLAAQIRGWETLLSSGQAPSLPTRKPTSWRDCTQHVLAHCRDMAAGRSGGSQPAKAQAA